MNTEQLSLIETTEEMEMVLTKYTCKRCGYKWIPRTEKPGACPSCHSPIWNVPLSKTTKRGRPRKKK